MLWAGLGPFPCRAMLVLAHLTWAKFFGLAMIHFMICLVHPFQNYTSF
jgi:hypothetical protein